MKSPWMALGLAGGFGLLVLTGCSDPASKVPAAQVSAASTNAAPAPAQPVAATAAPAAAPRHYAATGAGGTINFIGSKVTGSHSGGFKTFAAEFVVQDGKVADRGNRVVIDMDSTWSDNEKLTGHLKSPDFFDVAKFGNAIFETVSVAPGTPASMVTGNLTLHGVTQKIAFPAQIEVTEQALSLTAKFSINRMDFNIKYPGRADDLIREDVVLDFNIKATPGRADFQAVEKSPVPVPPSA
jgi:polyisoprenoid-binding protein YceI